MLSQFDYAGGEVQIRFECGGEQSGDHIYVDNIKVYATYEEGLYEGPTFEDEDF